MTDDGRGGGFGLDADAGHFLSAKLQGAEADAVGMGGCEDGVEECDAVLQQLVVELLLVVEGGVVAVEVGPVGEQRVEVGAVVVFHCHMGIVGVCLFACLVCLLANEEGLGDVFACDNLGEVAVCDFH